MWLAYWTWTENNEASWDPCICASKMEIKEFYDNTKEKYWVKGAGFTVHPVGQALPPAEVTNIAILGRS